MDPLLRTFAFTGIAASIATPAIVSAVHIAFWRELGELPAFAMWHISILVLLCAVSGFLSWLALQLARKRLAN